MNKLFILIIEGTSRPERRSLQAAKLIEEVGKAIPEIEAQLVSPEDFNLPFDGDDQAYRDPKYSALTKKADGFFIIVPEYNHSFPGSLKRLLDSEYENYFHKAVAFAGVSSGSWGGTRAIESLVPVVRELGLVATNADMHFPRIKTLFDENGKITNEKDIQRIENAYKELIFMAKSLKYGRENLVKE